MEDVGTSRFRWLQDRRTTIILACITLLVLALSVPGSLRHNFENDMIYLFSRSFFEDIPRRLTGPGRFRFILQPLIAILFGINNGRADALLGRPPFIYGLLFHKELRGELMRSAFRTVINLVLMGILMDSLFQWVIFGVSHPGAAVVVGPLLIGIPYAIARALANRLSRLRSKRLLSSSP